MVPFSPWSQGHQTEPKTLYSLKNPCIFGLGYPQSRTLNKDIGVNVFFSFVCEKVGQV